MACRQRSKKKMWIIKPFQLTFIFDLLYNKIKSQRKKMHLMVRFHPNVDVMAKESTNNYLNRDQ